MTEQLHFDRTLQKLNILFRYSGINLESRKRTPIQTIIYRCLYMINFLWLNSDILGEIFWFVDSIKKGKSFIEIAYIAPCFTISMLGNFKSFFHILNEDKVSQLIEDLRELERKERDRNKNSNEIENEKKEEMIKEETGFLNVVLTPLIFWNLMTVVAFALSPLTLMMLHYMKTNEIQFILPFFALYPFDAYSLRYWPIMYIHQVWSAMIVVLQLGGVDCTFYTCCSYLRIQFRLLKQDIETIITTSDNFRGKLYEDNELRHKLIDLIKWHQDIIRLVNLMETISSKTTLFHFVTSSFLICLCGFNVTVSDEIALVITFMIFMLMNLTQIFLLCFFGDMIMRSSMDISEAVYNCQWYLADTKLARKLFLIQIRAQKPCKLTAARYADVNLRAFTKILSTSWSYFALLNTVYRSPHFN